MVNKLCIIGLIFAAASGLAAAQVTLPENTALFTTPDPFSTPAGAVSGEVEVSREFCKYTHVHPLAYRHKFYEIVRDGKTFYASPEIRADSTQILEFPLFRRLAMALAAAPTPGKTTRSAARTTDGSDVTTVSTSSASNASFTLVRFPAL